MCYYHLSRFWTQVDSLHQGLSYDCSQAVGEAGVISKAVLFTQVWPRLGQLKKQAPLASP